MTAEIKAKQLVVCQRFDVTPFPVSDDQKVGIARNVRTGLSPLNGLRLPPEADTTGWYIWAGEEWTDDPAFFVPLHVEHLGSWRPEVLPYLQLPPGWRFLLAPHYEDVWFDASLLQGIDE
jgi:hypothetical protein